MESGTHYRRDLGITGEDLACRLLESKGHKILERNFRSGHLEIDIISQDPAGIHFVEVKTRQKNVQAPPQLNVDRNKQRRIARAAQAYLRKKSEQLGGSYECLFDVVAITFSCGEVQARLMENAYIPMFL